MKEKRQRWYARTVEALWRQRLVWRPSLGSPGWRCRMPIRLMRLAKPSIDRRDRSSSRVKLNRKAGMFVGVEGCVCFLFPTSHHFPPPSHQPPVSKGRSIHHHFPFLPGDFGQLPCPCRTRSRARQFSFSYALGLEDLEYDPGCVISTRFYGTTLHHSGLSFGP